MNIKHSSPIIRCLGLCKKRTGSPKSYGWGFVTRCGACRRNIFHSFVLYGVPWCMSNGAWWRMKREGERYYEAYISYGEKVLLSYAFSRRSCSSYFRSLQPIEELGEREQIVTWTRKREGRGDRCSPGEFNVEQLEEILLDRRWWQLDCIAAWL